ncbi:MAG: hypothetical protein RL735_557 [Pseudomonadota bacterium]|jgi:hypothetical protein
MSEFAFLPEAILALVALECAALIYWRLKRGRGPAPLDIVANLAAGACLLLAVRAALLGDAAMLLVFLAASGLAHVFDLMRRWK